MKILYLHQYFNTPSMPGSTRSFEFSSRLVEAGNVVHMVTSNWQGMSNRKFSKESGINVYWAPVKYSNKMGFMKRIKSFMLFIYYVLKISSKLDFNLIIASSTPLTIGIPALLLKKTRKTKLIFEVRDLWPQLPIAMGFLKSKLLIFLSKWLENKLLRYD